MIFPGDLLYGILSITLSFGLFYFTYRKFREEQFEVAVFLLMLGGLVLRIYTASDFFLHEWDERYHALVAKNMMGQPWLPTLYKNPVLPFSIEDWTSNHVWLHKQPVALWFMSASISLFGTNELAVRLPSILFSTLSIYLVYRIGTYFKNREVGILAAFFMAINGLVIELTAGRVATDHVDICFMFFILLSVFLTLLYAQKNRWIFNVLAGLALGTAILTKWLPALIVLPLWLIVVWNMSPQPKKWVILNFVLFSGIAAIVFLPWQIYIHSAFPLEAAHEAGFNFRHLTETIEEHSGGIFYFLHKIRINYGELIYLPMIWFLYTIFRRKDWHPVRLATAVWMLGPLLVFSLAETKMQGYLLISAPAFFIVTAYFFFFLLDLYQQKNKYRWLIAVVLFALVALPVRYSIERIKPFSDRDRSPQWVSDLKAFPRGEGLLFNYPHPVEAMFYTDLTVYSSIPADSTVQRLLRGGYDVFILDDGKVDDATASIEGVELVQLRVENP